MNFSLCVNMAGFSGLVTYLGQLLILYSRSFSLGANFPKFHKWAHYLEKFMQLWIAIVILPEFEASVIRQLCLVD